MSTQAVDTEKEALLAEIANLKKEMASALEAKDYEISCLKQEVL
jgi:hypothetical protein